FITCQSVVKDDAGNVTELHCTYDPETRGGDAPDGRKVKGTIHWVSAAKGQRASIRLYDHLFASETPGTSGDAMDDINPDSLSVLEHCILEPALATAEPGVTVQFERQGYFCADPDSTPEKLVFNRTIALRDSWAKTKGK
ncbi:MAG: glutamine--tRNA ligase, partial [Rhodospirillales bacterium]|nr:glutamine--tRNA ligase [Rhodospirillales bacterium]